jgi:hypothetical protein
VLVTESDTRRLERRVLELEQELSKLKDEKALLSGVPTAELRLRG